MPTYEYKCLKCGKVFEQFQQMTDPALEVCPECGGAIKRLIGAGAGPIFKGNGFYHTDYKMKSNANNTRPSRSETKTTSDKIEL